MSFVPFLVQSLLDKFSCVVPILVSIINQRTIRSQILFKLSANFQHKEVEKEKKKRDVIVLLQSCL